MGQFIPVQISSSTKLSNGEKKVLQKKAVKDKVLKIPRRYKCSYSVKDDANVTKVLELLIEASSHLDPIFNRYVAFQYFINTFLSFLCDFFGQESNHFQFLWLGDVRESLTESEFLSPF